ncbi:MAG: inverse autotransporter beta domain-containing protein [Rickettsiaceae bacterium]
MKCISSIVSVAMTTTILSSALVTSFVAKADSAEYVYNPAAEVTTKFSKGRNIAEIDYLHPFLAKDNQLPLINLKLKLDDKRSKEINLGLVYRYNYEDKAILGAYAYFDHRQTRSHFSVSGLTAGVEVLSEYIDARANMYIPENKRKKIAHNKKKTIQIEGSSIFAMSGGHRYERALKGYDIEVGVPLFAFSESLNQKFGTKIFAGGYSFSAKDVKTIQGTRFRIEQDLGKVWAGENSYKFHVSAETQYDKVRKRQNFIGLGMKVAFNDKQNSYKKKKSGLKHRMMDTVIRDVDIVTESINEAPTRSNFHMNGKPINNIYYVGSAQGGYSGDGTKDSATT